MTTRETKSFGGVEIKADTDKRMIKGYAAIFGNVDSHEDIIESTAFDKTLANEFERARVKTLWQHDYKTPIGVPSKLETDTKGLYFESPVVKTLAGDQALELIDAGVITEMSIGFKTVEADWREDDTARSGWVRILRELGLWEVSPVTWGSNSSTSVEMTKALDELNALEALCEQVKAGRVLSQANFSKLEDAIGRLEEIRDAATPAEDEATKTARLELERALDTFVI